MEGENTGEEILHPVGLLATLAAASLANPETEIAREFVTRFWQTPFVKACADIMIIFVCFCLYGFEW